MMYMAALLFLFPYMVFTCCKLFRSRKSMLPVDLPLVGTLLSQLLNMRRLHQFLTEALEESGGTIMLKGPSFVDMNILLTADPANVHYVLTKNFRNFGKGPDFKKIFDVLGDGIFIAEAESWENQRKVAKSFMNNINFQQFAARTTWKKVETGLVPILDSASKTGEIVDLQEIFQRLAFDCSCLTVLGHDPGSLSKELPLLPHEKAFGDAEEALLYRNMVPVVIWQLQRWLQIGTEKKLSRAKESMDHFLSNCFSLKEQAVEQSDDLLACYKRALADKRDAMNISEELWKDASLNFVFAGKDTISAALTWFFWLLSTNPVQEKKIKQEIMEVSKAGGEKWSFSDIEELKKLVYLHGALCETLRLFPPVALQHKAPLEDDILPSGHAVKATTRTILSFYSMGRMESIWGEDCLEFKPERWISDKGTIKIVPSFMFPAFNAGPRSCIGKDMSFIQLKIVAAAVISRFCVEVAEAHPVLPRASVILHMEHGLKVKVSNQDNYI